MHKSRIQVLAVDFYKNSFLIIYIFLTSLGVKGLRFNSSFLAICYTQLCVCSQFLPLLWF